MPDWEPPHPTCALLCRGAPRCPQVQPHLHPLHSAMCCLAHALQRAGMRWVLGAGARRVRLAMHVAGRPLGMAQIPVRLLGRPVHLLYGQRSSLVRQQPRGRVS